jgi:hypothetical protein
LVDTDRERALEYDGPIQAMPRDVEIEAPFDAEQTPTKLEEPGACWRCWRIMPVQIVSPPPGSSHEALRFHTCIASAGGGWAWCAATMVLRLGTFELYLGPNRRRERLPAPGTERRRFPPRKDDDE